MIAWGDSRVRVMGLGCVGTVALAGLATAGCTGLAAGPSPALPHRESSGPTSPPSGPPPGPAGMRRLTAAQFRASLTSLLGPVFLPEVEADTRIQGLAQVGASHTSLTAAGTEALETSAREALRQVF